MLALPLFRARPTRGHFGIDNRACAVEAQEFGYAAITGYLDSSLSPSDSQAYGQSRDIFGFWQVLLRVVLVRRLPALPRGLPVGKRLSRPSRPSRKESRRRRPRKSPRRRHSRRAPKGRHAAGAQRLEQALGRPDATKEWSRTDADRSERRKARAACAASQSNDGLFKIAPFPGPITADRSRRSAVLRRGLVGIADSAEITRPARSGRSGVPSESPTTMPPRKIVSASGSPRVTRIALWNERHKTNDS